jgi:tetratricopeptide (TPR) repeat protein
VFAAARADSVDQYFSPENIYRFADFLYNTGDYMRAVPEYLRYLFIHDSLPGNADSVYFKIGRCFRLSGNHNAAIRYFDKIKDQFQESQLIVRSAYETACALHQCGKFESSNILLEKMTNLEEYASPVERFRMLEAANYLELMDWESAAGVFDGSSGPDTVAQQMLSFARDGAHLPHKLPVLAGFYSALIPGAGKIYCHRPFDALQSFLTIGVLGWQTYSGFDKDGVGSAKGWIFGVIGGVFYIGNIYGSIVAADIYNEEQQEKLLTKIRVYINARLY